MSSRNKPKSGFVSDRSRRRRGILLGLIGFVTLLLLLSIGKRGFLAQWRVRKERERLKNSIEKLVEQQERLQEEKEKLDDPEYIEKIAREEYGMAKENERVYQVVPKEE